MNGESANFPPAGESVALPDCRSDAYEPVKQCIACLPEQGMEITYENLRTCTDLSRNKLQVPLLRLEKAGVLERVEPIDKSRTKRHIPGPPTTVRFVPTEAGAKLLPPKTPAYCHLQRQLADPFALLPPAQTRAAECIRCMLTRGRETIQTGQVVVCSGVARNVIKHVLDDGVEQGIFTRTMALRGVKHGTLRQTYILTEDGRGRIAPRLVENCPQVELEEAAIVATLTPRQRLALDTIYDLQKQQQDNPFVQLTLCAISEASGIGIATLDGFMGLLVREGYFERERQAPRSGVPFMYHPTPLHPKQHFYLRATWLRSRRPQKNSNLKRREYVCR